MGHRVVCNLVPFGDHSSNEFRLIGHVGADNEERRRHPMLRQHIEDVRRAEGVWPIIEGQVDRASSADVIIVAPHRGQGDEFVHSSGPFRSIIVPAGHSPNERSSGNTTTRTSSMRIGDKLG